MLLPFMWHVHCACFNGLWGRGGLPLTGRRCFCLSPALGRGLARAMHAADRGWGLAVLRRRAIKPPLEGRMSSSNYNFIGATRPTTFCSISLLLPLATERAKKLRSSDRVGPQQPVQPDNVVSEGKVEQFLAGVNFMAILPVSE